MFGVMPFVYQMSDDGREEVQYEYVHNGGERGYLQSRANDPRFRRVDTIAVTPAARVMALSFIASHEKLERLYDALPGGLIEVGESPRQCILRELYEETRQTADKLEFAGLMKFHI